MTITKKEIRKLYKEYKVTENIIAHMEKVAKFALNLCEKFEKRGHKIDKKSVISACLLHDVLRYCDFKTIPDKSPEIWAKIRKKYNEIGHEKAMAKILKKNGHSKIANLVEKHDFFKVDNLKTIEEKIVFYSDKRVDHDKVVSLKKRFKEGRKRNFSDCKNTAEIDVLESKIFKLEKEINFLLKKRQ